MDKQSPKPSTPSKQPRFCRICGDLATEYNFNVITCDSCKAFFRRNCVTKKVSEKTHTHATVFIIWDSLSTSSSLGISMQLWRWMLCY